jgi:hypothetical protein
MVSRTRERKHIPQWFSICSSDKLRTGGRSRKKSRGCSIKSSINVCYSETEIQRTRLFDEHSLCDRLLKEYVLLCDGDAEILFRQRNWSTHQRYEAGKFTAQCQCSSTSKHKDCSIKNSINKRKACSINALTATCYWRNALLCDRDAEFLLFKTTPTLQPQKFTTE